MYISYAQRWASYTGLIERNRKDESYVEIDTYI